MRRNPNIHRRILDRPQTLQAEPYEARLGREMRWALTESSQFFEGKGAVQEAMHKIVRRLDTLEIPYAVVGGMALFSHGVRRFTEDVDLLVTPQSLKAIHEHLDGLGYLPSFVGSKQLRDADLGVKIEFRVTGQYPGDGKPKPVSFPDPVSVTIERDGIRYLDLPTLVELKLASGMTNAARLKDLSDVVELIKALDLPKAFASQISPFVREKYEELWQSLQTAPRRFVSIWRSKSLTIGVKSLDEMAAKLREAGTALEAMLADGVTLDTQGGTVDDHARLVTTDPLIARKYGMHDESDYLDTAEDGNNDSDDRSIAESGQG